MERMAHLKYIQTGPVILAKRRNIRIDPFSKLTKRLPGTRVFFVIFTS